MVIFSRIPKKIKREYAIKSRFKYCFKIYVVKFLKASEMVIGLLARTLLTLKLVGTLTKFLVTLQNVIVKIIQKKFQFNCPITTTLWINQQKKIHLTLTIHLSNLTSIHDITIGNPRSIQFFFSKFVLTLRFKIINKHLQ
jgi:hypothetical protein